MTIKHIQLVVTYSYDADTESDEYKTLDTDQLLAQNCMDAAVGGLFDLFEGEFTIFIDGKEVDLGEVEDDDDDYEDDDDDDEDEDA